jgi:hypothetical protein
MRPPTTKLKTGKIQNPKYELSRTEKARKKSVLCPRWTKSACIKVVVKAFQYSPFSKTRYPFAERFWLSNMKTRSKTR